MNELLARILEAHGGMDRWRRYEKVEATIVSGGGLFALKGVLQDSVPRRMAVWLHEERSSVFPYGASDQRTMFTSRLCARAGSPAHPGHAVGLHRHQRCELLVVIAEHAARRVNLGFS